MVKYEWLEEYATSKPGARKDYKEEWEAFRYLVGDKMFIMHAHDKEGREIYTLKLEPSFGDFLRQKYPDEIVPGYYMNKDHWNSIYVDGGVPDDVLKDMIDKSYGLVFESLPKKVREEILN